MDKQKIEEMANDMGVSCGECYTCKYEGEVKCINFLCAEELYKAGYRKIPEGAVVILDEEMEDFAEMFAKSPQMQETMSHLIKAWRKETAETFAERLKEMAYQSTDWSHGEHPMVVEVEYIDEICKEFTEDNK